MCVYAHVCALFVYVRVCACVRVYVRVCACVRFSLFQQQFAGQGVTLWPALQLSVQQQRLPLPPPEIAGQHV